MSNAVFYLGDTAFPSDSFSNFQTSKSRRYIALIISPDLKEWRNYQSNIRSQGSKNNHLVQRLSQVNILQKIHMYTPDVPLISEYNLFGGVMQTHGIPSAF